MDVKCILKAMLVIAGLTTLTGAAQGQVIGNVPRYEQDYPVIDYSGAAQHNCIARLQDRIVRGEVPLQYEPRWGYLRSILDATGMSIESQVLVYSKTSLQTDWIGADTPRAIYFNDDCYVAWVQGSSLLEFVAVDADRGVVFYSLDNRPPAAVRFEREGGRCLTCHDTYSMTGGGVPRVLVMSAPVDSPADTHIYSSATEVTDKTPVAQRWGGWYVTGQHGQQTHLGNLPLREQQNTPALRDLSPHDRQSLAGYFDTSKYLSDRSDIAALLVMEHQSSLQNLIVRVNFKIRTVMSRSNAMAAGGPRSWEQVSPTDQRAVRAMMEPLVKALFFTDAASLNDAITGSTDFARQFAARGPRDPQGRSLRDLDLETRVFRYPLSYLVYSEAFEALPAIARDYVGSRIVEVLQGEDRTGLSDSIQPDDRRAVKEILTTTSARFAALFAGAAQR